jgi:hypothetical protein
MNEPPGRCRPDASVSPCPIWAVAVVERSGCPACLGEEASALLGGDGARATEMGHLSHAPAAVTASCSLSRVSPQHKVLGKGIQCPNSWSEMRFGGSEHVLTAGAVVDEWGAPDSAKIPIISTGSGGPHLYSSANELKPLTGYSWMQRALLTFPARSA